MSLLLRWLVTMVPTDDATQKRFWTKVDKTESCWIWTAARIPKGYGRFAAWSRRNERRCVYAHRYSYEMHHGEEIPEGKHIDHMCGEPSCVRPSHLQLVTPSENQHNIRGRGKYRGVSRSGSGKWRARVMLAGKEISFGSHETEEDAALAALEGRIQLYTHNARDRGFRADG